MYTIEAEFEDGVTMYAQVQDDLEGLDAVADMEEVRGCAAIRTAKEGEPWGWEYDPDGLGELVMYYGHRSA